MMYTGLDKHRENREKLSKLIIDNMKEAIDGSPYKAFSAEIFVQLLKYHQDIKDAKVTAREFTRELDLPAPYVNYFNVAMRVAPRLVEAGLDLDAL